jgi:hypothetical protein
MITLSLKQKTNENGHLVIDIQTILINKDVDVVLIIQENATSANNNKGINTRKKYDFSHLFGKLEWQSNALEEQRKIRSEWE